MEPLLRRVGATGTDFDRVRAALGQALRADLDTIVEQAATRTLQVAGYETLTLDRVRPNTRRGMQAVLATLEGSEWEAFGAQFHDIARIRARQGLPSRALHEVAALTELSLYEVAAHALRGSDDLLVAAAVVRRIGDSARVVLEGAFQEAHSEAREAVERMARQFSAPVLPVLPGVLLLPIVGAISPARARQILDALLAGVAAHGAHTVLLDLTGLIDHDLALTDHIRHAAAAVRLLGARLVLIGLGPGVARMFAESGVSLHGISVHATLATALLAAFARAELPGRS